MIEKRREHEMRTFRPFRGSNDGNFLINNFFCNFSRYLFFSTNIKLDDFLIKTFLIILCDGGEFCPFSDALSSTPPQYSGDNYSSGSIFIVTGFFTFFSPLFAFHLVESSLDLLKNGKQTSTTTTIELLCKFCTLFNGFRINFLSLGIYQVTSQERKERRESFKIINIVNDK